MAAITFSGLASGIDSTSLIKSLLDTERKVKVNPLSVKIDALTATNDAFAQIKTLLADLDTASSAFRTVNNGPLARAALSSNDGRISATATGTAALGSYNIDVLAMAKNATFSFGTSFSSASATVSGSLAGSDLDRTISFQIGTGGEAQTVDVVLDNTSTLDSFVSQFNSQTTAATASVIKVANGDYRLSISSTQTGVEKGTVSLTSLGSAYSTAGVLTTNTVSQATDAQFIIDGLGNDPIARATNTISDVITGLTLNLQDLGSATVTIATDNDETLARAQAFVDAYNELRTFVTENDIVERDESGSEVKNVFGALAGTSIDNNLLTALKSAFSSSALGSGSVRILADLGITTQRDGSLSLNTTTFTEALEDNPTEVESLLSNLGENLSSVDGTIAQFARFSGILDTAVRTNTESISEYNASISDAEARLSRREQELTQQFARLESLMSKLNSQQASLASILPS